MTAVALLLLTAAEVGAGLLVVSGWRHRQRRRELVHHLRRHRVVPDRAIHATSFALPAVSMAVGGAALVLPVLGAPVLRVAVGLEGVVYLGFLGYLVLLHRRSPGESCGCLGRLEERPGTAIARAAVLSLAALATSVVAPPVTLTEGVVAAAVGGLAGVLLVRQPLGRFA